MKPEDLEEQPDREAGPLDVSEEDEKLLKHIRERYSALDQMWRPIREERQTDIRYLCGDPWEDDDKRARKEAGRPCINHDELTQYVNQAVNNLRQNKRGIKVDPEGNGSSEKTAEFRQNLIRGIEYKSKAQSAYLRAAQDMYEGSYGFCRIGRRYVSEEPDGPDDQEITIGAILNPDSVLYGFDYCKQPDWSDARDCFVLDPISKEDFKREYPNARIQDFTAEHKQVAKDWIQDKQVLTAEYWRVEVKETKKKRGRTIKQRTVVQYITNGVEILERTEQPGVMLPIIPFLGLMRYIDEGQGPQMKLFSLIRLAREPQMSLAFVVSQQMEEAGLSPKVPYLGYVGQFETDKEGWVTATKIPHAYLQVDPMIDAAPGQLLPLPQRVPFTPNFQEYEAAKDSCRRAIQAAMGIAPLPTAAQRQNEKSGIALEKIESQENLGSYHFVEAFENALQYAGRVIEDWIDVVYANERDVVLREPDESHQVVHINTDGPYLDEEGKERHYPVINQGDHYVTVSTAPWYMSQREAVAAFLDTLINNMQPLVAAGIVAPPAAAKLLSMAIQMRDMGPKGDQIAEVIDPENPDASNQLHGLQQQMQMSQVAMQQMQGELQKLMAEKRGKIVDNQYKMALEKMKEEHDIAMAEINTKAQQVSERAEWVQDMWSQLHGQAHEAALQAMDQGHQQTMTALQPQPQPVNGAAQQ